jgi:hypothetical protein
MLRLRLLLRQQLRLTSPLMQSPLTQSPLRLRRNKLALKLKQHHGRQQCFSWCCFFCGTIANINKEHFLKSKF